MNLPMFRISGILLVFTGFEKRCVYNEIFQRATHDCDKKIRLSIGKLTYLINYRQYKFSGVSHESRNRKSQSKRICMLIKMISIYVYICIDLLIRGCGFSFSHPRTIQLFSRYFKHFSFKWKLLSYFAMKKIHDSLFL